jgi:nitric oxide dioxygenase
LKSARERGTHVSLEDMIEFARDGIVSKIVVRTSGKEVSLFCMSSGQSISTHRSGFPAIIHVIRGTGEVTLEEKKYHAQPNTLFYMPTNLPHSVQASDNLVFLLTLFKEKEKQT